MSDHQRYAGALRTTILPAVTITAAVANQLSPVVKGLDNANSLVMQAVMAVGTGGTTIDAYVQTSVDNGATWFDIANFHFLTTPGTKLSVVTMFPSTAFAANTAPSDGSLANNTVLNGILGNLFRVKYTTVGTYSGGTTLAIDIISKP